MRCRPGARACGHPDRRGRGARRQDVQRRRRLRPRGHAPARGSVDAGGDHRAQGDQRAPRRRRIAPQTPGAGIASRVAPAGRTAILTAPTGRAALRVRRPRRNRACRFPSKKFQSAVATFGAPTTPWKCPRCRRARAAASRESRTGSARTAATITAAKWLSPSNHPVLARAALCFPDRAARPPAWRMG